LPEKLIYPKPALLAYEFDHKFDIVPQSMNSRVKRAAEYAGIPAAIDDKEFCVQAIQHFTAFKRGRLIIRLFGKFRCQ